LEGNAGPNGLPMKARADPIAAAPAAAAHGCDHFFAFLQAAAGML
jgi:hypothetical protein